MQCLSLDKVSVLLSIIQINHRNCRNRGGILQPIVFHYLDQLCMKDKHIFQILFFYFVTQLSVNFSFIPDSEILL